jgi:hypothetical protein
VPNRSGGIDTTITEPRPGSRTTAITITPQSPTIGAEIGAVDLGADFGELEVHPFAPPHPEHPEVLRITHGEGAPGLPVTIMGDTPFHDPDLEPAGLPPRPFKGQIEMDRRGIDWRR